MANNFSFDIQKQRTIEDPKLDPKSPLAALYESPYGFTNRYYPRDLGSATRGHYINFYINVANNSQYLQNKQYKLYGASEIGAEGSGVSGRTAINQTQFFQNSAKELSTLGGPDNKEKGLLGGSAASTMELLTVRKTKRIHGAIALYMPETVNVKYGASWEDTSLTQAGGKALGIAQGVTSVADTLGDDSQSLSSIASNPAIAEAVGTQASNLGLGSGAEDFLLYAGGSALNPQLEVLFKGTPLREFQFDFLFSPYDSEESKNVLEIIRTFKFHQAPELNTGSFGRYFVPPSEFDIDFIFNGKKNRNLHQIGTCVLNDMTVDYAPNGWATFNDGMPTQIRLTLSFKEVEIVTKQRVMEGY